ncbi:MAG: hypothetical protein GDA52_11765, partial [Rhodobacteraceae bacterium]|nr:hypothetical protein [Paracoccaceae bacterium]
TLRGGQGNDYMRGGGGDDLLHGGAGDDSLTGYAGDDLLVGGWGDDHLGGNAGADTLEGGRGDDWLSGGSGANSYVIANHSGHDNIWNFTFGEDVIIFRGDDVPDSFDDLTFTLVDRDGNPHEKGWREEYRESHWGDNPPNSWFNTLITWGDEDSSILMQPYEDKIRPVDLSAEDFIFAEGAADTTGARGKVNELEGTDASDTLTGSSGRDSVDGGTGNDRLIGRADNDVINGGVGRDTLAGNRGDDTLDGGRYSDTLIGGHGDDVLTGGKWKDTFAFATGHGNDVITDFEDGMDLIHITASDVGFDGLAIADKGSAAVVTWDGGSITLEGVDHTALTADDFIFG